MDIQKQITEERGEKIKNIYFDKYPKCSKCGSYDVRLFFWGDNKFICLECNHYFDNN